MSKILYTMAFAAGILCSLKPASGQDALTMQDINFNTINYNSAFTIEKNEVFGASLTNTTGGGIQDAGQINFMAYTQLKSADLALGTRVNSKYFGFLRTSNFELNTAKKIQLNSSSAFLASIGVGMQFSALRSGEFNEFVDQGDPIFNNDEFPQYRFTFSFGLGYIWKNLSVGLSMPAFAKTESNLNPIYIQNTSYKYEASEDIVIHPQLLLFGSDVKAITGELSAKAEYKERVWLKAGYRSSNTFVGGLGVMVSGIDIGYAYNAFFQEFNAVVPATHNINLTFRIITGGTEAAGRKYQLD
ncbi:MAG: type IX secretion system membrane protein PorP/SprF [Bacteroidota bacterium]